MQLPSVGDLWGCYVDFDMKRMDSWERIVPMFKYNKEVPFFEMLVPTVDTVRFGYLLEKLLKVNQSVLYTGNTGVGKVRKIFSLVCIIIQLWIIYFLFGCEANCLYNAGELIHILHNRVRSVPLYCPLIPERLGLYVLVKTHNICASYAHAFQL